MTTTGLPDVGTELREGYAEVGDVSLHYVEAGDSDGPLVVLLHGFPEFWYGWRQQIAPLVEAGFRVVAPDLRGYNLSSKPGGFRDYTADKLAADVRGLIRELGAESAMVVGHDWGGTVAWTLAMNHPEVVDRLAILNAAHPRKLNEGLRNPRQLLRSWYFFFFQFPKWPEHHARARNWRFFKRFLRDARPQNTPEELDRYVDAWSQPGAATAMIDYYRAAVRLGSTQEVRPISAPTLVIWGQRDRYLGPSSPSRTTTTCPTSTGSSACPTPRTGSTTTRQSASTNCSSTSSPRRTGARSRCRSRRRGDRDQGSTAQEQRESPPAPWPAAAHVSADRADRARRRAPPSPLATHVAPAPLPRTVSGRPWRPSAQQPRASRRPPARASMPRRSSPPPTPSPASGAR